MNHPHPEKSDPGTAALLRSLDGGRNGRESDWAPLLRGWRFFLACIHSALVRPGRHTLFAKLAIGNLVVPQIHDEAFALQLQMNNPSPPEKQGLYDPQFEHDACGVGFVVT